jgi:hypothetical protein
MSAANKIFVYRQGAQGPYDRASKMELAAEFDTDDSDEVIQRILQQGTMQSVEVSLFIYQSEVFFNSRALILLVFGQMPGRQGVTNESMSSMRVK